MLMSVAFSRMPLVGLGLVVIGAAMMLLSHDVADVRSAGHDCIVAGVALCVVKGKESDASPSPGTTNTIHAKENDNG
jgi:hypothetical protein